MRRDRRIHWAAVFATALFAAFSLHTSLAARSEELQAPQTAEAVENIRKLTKEGHYRDAEAAARVVVAQLGAAGGRDSLETAAALDLLVEALWQGGKSRDAEA